MATFVVEFRYGHIPAHCTLSRRMTNIIRRTVSDWTFDESLVEGFYVDYD